MTGVATSFLMTGSATVLIADPTLLVTDEILSTIDVADTGSANSFFNCRSNTFSYRCDIINYRCSR